MQVKLKCAVKLHGNLYAPGVHVIPDAALSHWFFLALQKDGNAIVLDGPKVQDEIVLERIDDSSDEAIESDEIVDDSGKKKRRKRK